MFAYCRGIHVSCWGSRVMLRRAYSRKQFRKVTHCIFDLDGTVLDSEVMYHKIITEICEKYGKKYSKELETRMYGETDHEICVTVVDELKLPISVDEFELQLTDLAQKILPSSPLLKGAERLLTHLYDYNIPMALATNSTEQAVRLHATARPKLFGMFSHKYIANISDPAFTERVYSVINLKWREKRKRTSMNVSVTDPEVDRGKPNPDIYLVAAARFPSKPKPSNCLVFEDSKIGVDAAREAGMQVVMIPDPRVERELTRRATLVLRSLLDFKPELFGLPPFDNTKNSK